MLSTFADMSDDLNEVYRDNANTQTPKAAKPTFREVCDKCSGSGVWRGATSLGHSNCTRCGGIGYVERKTSPDQRAKVKAQKVTRDAAKKQAILDAFAEAHPTVVAWWTDSTFDFAVNMRANLERWGSLTGNQLAACYRCIEKFEAAKVARAVVAASAPEVSAIEIEKVFATATGNGLKKPVLRLAGFRFSLPKADSKNAGAIYVKVKGEDGEGIYLGKIMGGKFMKSRDCSDDQQTEIVACAANPKEAAIAYGRLTGGCSVCGRELTDAASVAAGIGPICSERLGW